MDKLYDEEANARMQVLNVLSLLNNFNTENPNTMILQFFFQGKLRKILPEQRKIHRQQWL